MTLLYVCGPMTGVEALNFPEFNRVESELRKVAFEVYNPATLGVVHDWAWKDYLRFALRHLLSCDGVALLDGWQESRGAMLESYVAAHLDMPIKHWQHWINGDDDGQ